MTDFSGPVRGADGGFTFSSPPVHPTPSPPFHPIHPLTPLGQRVVPLLQRDDGVLGRPDRRYVAVLLLLPRELAELAQPDLAVAVHIVRREDHVDGSSQPLHTGLGYPGGIDIHSDGWIFLVDLIGTLRIDPATGQTETLLDGTTFSMPNGLTLSVDDSLLYVGTWDGIEVVPLDTDGFPTGPASLFATSPDAGELLGMGVDACDNVYALWKGEKLLRWAPDGSGPETLMEVPPGAWMTNLQWGSGIGGWDDHTIYITDRQTSNPAYYAIDVGVPAKR